MTERPSGQSGSRVPVDVSCPDTNGRTSAQDPGQERKAFASRSCAGRRTVAGLCGRFIAPADITSY